MVLLAEMLFLMAAGFIIVLAALFAFALFVGFAFWSWSHIALVIISFCLGGGAYLLRRAHAEF